MCDFDVIDLSVFVECVWKTIFDDGKSQMIHKKFLCSAVCDAYASKKKTIIPIQLQMGFFWICVWLVGVFIRVLLLSLCVLEVAIVLKQSKAAFIRNRSSLVWFWWPLLDRSFVGWMFLVKHHWHTYTDTLLLNLFNKHTQIHMHTYPNCLWHCSFVLSIHKTLSDKRTQPNVFCFALTHGDAFSAFWLPSSYCMQCNKCRIVCVWFFALANIRKLCKQIDNIYSKCYLPLSSSSDKWTCAK